MTIEKHLLEK